LTNIGAPNRLLRQYFAKGTDLSVFTADYLDSVAAELNDRPRKRLDFAKPVEKIGPLLLRDRQDPPIAQRGVTGDRRMVREPSTSRSLVRTSRNRAS